MTAHLRLVPSAPRTVPFEMEVFAFCKVGSDIFICRHGEWNLARNCPDAANALLRWTSAINPNPISSVVAFPADEAAHGVTSPPAHAVGGSFSTGDEPVLRWPLRSAARP